MLFLSIAVSDKQLEYAFWKLAETRGRMAAELSSRYGMDTETLCWKS